MGYKRENITDVSPLGIKKINDNITNLWEKVFGDINLTDVAKDVKNELYTNWLQPQGEGNLDSSHPFYIRFYIPENTTKIKKANLNLIVSRYRMDSGVANSNTAGVSISGFSVGQSTNETSTTVRDKNGQPFNYSNDNLIDTTPSFASKSAGMNLDVDPYFVVKPLASGDLTGQEDSAGGKKDYSGNIIPIGTSVTDIKWHYHHIKSADFQHSHDMPHSHSFSGTGSLPVHTHPLNEGVKESGTAPQDVRVYINDEDMGVNLSESNSSLNNLDISQKLQNSIGQWVTIKITTSNLARITVYGIAELQQKY